MKLPETGEANSTMATREGWGGGVVLVGFQAENRAWNKGHESYLLGMRQVKVSSFLLYQLPNIAPIKR